MDTKLYGALEAGGTKMVLGIADADGRILHSHSLPWLPFSNRVEAVLR